MKEKLNADEKQKIINDFLHKVMQENPSYYYSPTTEIARAIHQKIQLEFNRLSIDEQILVKPLSVRDIEIILSIK